MDGCRVWRDWWVDLRWGGVGGWMWAGVDGWV